MKDIINVLIAANDTKDFDVLFKNISNFSGAKICGIKSDPNDILNSAIIYHIGLLIIDDLDENIKSRSIQLKINRLGLPISIVKLSDKSYASKIYKVLNSRYIKLIDDYSKYRNENMKIITNEYFLDYAIDSSNDIFMDRATVEREFLVPITDTLISLGYRFKFYGFRIMREAIILGICNPNLLNNMCKEFYPLLALQFNKTPLAIEILLRVATKDAIKSKKIKKLYEPEDVTNIEKISSTEVIRILVDRFRVRKKVEIMNSNL